MSAVRRLPGRPKHSHVRSDGKPKEAFTREEAIAKRDELEDYDMNNGRLMTCPVAYPCSEGDHWHVGNANPRIIRGLLVENLHTAPTPNPTEP